MSEVPDPDKALAELAEIQRQLNRTRADLEGKAAAGLATPVGTLRAGTTPPKTSGLTLVVKQGKLTAQWNDVPITDLRRYEVQIDTTADFLSPDVYNTGNTFLQFTDRDSGTTYFVRVRAVNQLDNAGEYSATVSGTPAQIVAGELADDSVTNPKVSDAAVDTSEIVDIAVTQAGEDNSAADTLTTTAETDIVTVASVVVDGGPVLIWTSSLHSQSGGGASPTTVTYRLYRDTTVIATHPCWSLIGNNLQYSYTKIDNPGAGTYTYKLTAQNGLGSPNVGDLANSTIMLMERQK